MTLPTEDPSLVVSDEQYESLVKQRERCDDLIDRIEKTRGKGSAKKPKAKPKGKKGKDGRVRYPSESAPRNRSAQGEVNEAQRKMLYQRERRQANAEIPYIKRTPEYQAKWELYERDLPAFIADNFAASAPKPFGPGQVDSLARIQAVLLSGGRLCDVEPRGFAKSLGLNVWVPTPSGWTTIGEVEPGDTLFDENGKTCTVQDVSPIFQDKPCLEFKFSDGSKVICSDDHRWTVHDSEVEEELVTVTASEIAEGMSSSATISESNPRFILPRVKQLEGVYPELRIHPRIEGEWRTAGFSQVAILSVKRVPTIPTKCLMVDSPSHLFLIGEGMIPTHNTSKCALSALWALFYGHRRCMPIFGSSMRQATKILQIIKSSVLASDELRKLNPWVVTCLLDARRRKNQSQYQHCDGKETGVGWGGDNMTMPTFLDEGHNGGTALVAPIKNARGLVIDNPVTGEILRPDFIFLDDVQTDEAAKKSQRVEDLEELIVHEALRLAGHHMTLAAVMTITCRAPDDLAEKFLKNTSWQAVRNKMLVTMATNEDLWMGPYADIRRDFKDGDENAQLRAKLKATEFYKKNQQKMDAGCTPGWDWGYGWADDPATEISAIQHAYNIIIDDGREVFECECQNTPTRITSLAESKMLTVKQIQAKTSRVERFMVPTDCHTVVAGIDVQERALYYKVAAFGDGFTGSFIDYGVWPEQPTRDQTYANLRVNFDQMYPNMRQGGKIVAALEDLVEYLHSKTYVSDDGVPFDLGTILVDRGHEAESIDLFCRRKKNLRVRSSRGVGVGPTDTPLEDRKLAKNERAGNNWQVKRTKNNTNVMYVLFDTNFWKSQYHEGLRVAEGDAGCLSYYEPQAKGEHFQVACNDTAEYPVPAAGRGRSLLVWKHRANKPDNHWLDAGVLCFVAASIDGIKFPIEAEPKQKRAIEHARQAPADEKSFAERLREGRNVFGGGRNLFGS